MPSPGEDASGGGVGTTGGGGDETEPFSARADGGGSTSMATTSGPSASRAFSAAQAAATTSNRSSLKASRPARVVGRSPVWKYCRVDGVEVDAAIQRAVNLISTQAHADMRPVRWRLPGQQVRVTAGRVVHAERRRTRTDGHGRRLEVVLAVLIIRIVLEHNRFDGLGRRRPRPLPRRLERRAVGVAPRGDAPTQRREHR